MGTESMMVFGDDQICGGWKRHKHKALLTTVTEESAVAAAANIGLRSMPKKGKRIPAAIGMNSVL